MPLPNLIIIGAQKCGTSSLKNYLTLHPEITMPDLEQHFFSHEHIWRKGVRWYSEQFSDAPVRGEKSISYSMAPFYPFVPERIARVAPDAKFIYLVRDPIDRTIAGWRYHQRHNDEARTFEETFSCLDDNVYLARSRYASQLERYLAHFPLERILVIDQHDLRHDRSRTLEAVFAHLDVDTGFTSPQFTAEAQVSTAGAWRSPGAAKLAERAERVVGRRLTRRIGSLIPRGVPGLERTPPDPPVVTDELRDRLAEILAPEAARLRDLTGQPFAHWSL